MPASPRRLLLIDGHGLAFRAYHALPEMTNRRGEAIRVAYGYTSMLLLALGQGFDCAVGAFDPPGPTFRDHKLATYKAQRKPTPDELVAQIPVCKQITEALNIPVVMVPGFEADDVLGTLSLQAREAGCQTVIISGDLDLLQLVDESTAVQMNRRGGTEPILYDVAQVKERFGFEPRRIIDYKALRGDPTDNIPGVPGIGEKTATSLLLEYGTLEAILAAVASMPQGKVRRSLEGHEEEARFGQEMVTIVRDVPGVALSLEQCRVRDYDREAAARLLEELGMPSLVRRLPSPEPSTQPVTAVAEAAATPSLVVDDERAMAAMVSAIRTAGTVVTVAVAAETPLRLGRLSGVALALSESQSWYCPIASADGLWGLRPEQLGPLFELLSDPGIPKSGYQLKDDLLALGGAGVHLAGGEFDCVLAAYLGDSRSRTPSLGALCREWGGPSLPDPELLLGKGVKARRISELSQEEAASLTGGEAAAAAAIRGPLQTHLEQIGGNGLLRDLELPVTGVLADMEMLGVRLDSVQLHLISAEVTATIAELETEMFRLAGHVFAPGSTSQLAAVLYDELGLHSARRTKTGRSTDAQTLEVLREEHPVVGLVLSWRQLSKLKSTYVDSLPELVDGSDGRVHTSFNQAVAATGRLSSSDPNLQNIPVRTELGRRIRAAFIPGFEGWSMVSADYSQIELRVLAHLSQDPELLGAFSRNEDIHLDTAARVFGVDKEQVSSEQRRMAKVVNFGILYGLSSFGLSRDLAIPTDVAGDFIKRYFETYSAVQDYLESVREEARQRGYVTTILGRRRYLSEINSSNRQVREANERMAINMPIQGSAADIMKLGMIRTQQALAASGLRARILLQVHDELLLEAPQEEVPEVAALVEQGMAGAIELKVPLVVDLKVGPNWRDLVPLALPDSSP